VEMNITMFQIMDTHDTIPIIDDETVMPNNLKDERTKKREIGSTRKTAESV